MTEVAPTVYPPLLRRSQALALAKEWGVTEHAFRILVPGGSPVRKKITGGRDHYRRDRLIEVFRQQAQQD